MSRGAAAVGDLDEWPLPLATTEVGLEAHCLSVAEFPEMTERRGEGHVASPASGVDVTADYDLAGRGLCDLLRVVAEL